MKPLKDPSDGAPTAVELRDAIMARRTTAEAVAQAAIARIVAREPDVHAWEVFAPELALAQARRVDAALAAGGAASGAGLLAGV
ncbi:MAG: amidase, partial [Gammaproteobacteria bacterium]|nr:amidase [Gammaproteobacteria bacterium]